MESIIRSFLDKKRSKLEESTTACIDRKLLLEEILNHNFKNSEQKRFLKKFIRSDRIKMFGKVWKKEASQYLFYDFFAISEYKINFIEINCFLNTFLR